MNNLDTVSWKEFKIGELFDVINNPQLDKENFVFSDDALYPYFTRTENNNGILGYVEYLDDKHKIRGNSLAVGMISMKFHYMFHDFYAGQFTKTLIPKFKCFNETLALYFISILNKHSSYYQSYLVREFVPRVKNTVCNLPVGKDGQPNWNYMTEYIKELEAERIKELEAYLIATELDDYELSNEDKEVLVAKPRWKEFHLGKLFVADKGDVDLQQKDINGKGYYFINSGVDNLGIKGRTDRPAKVFPANSITIDFWGYAYYRDFEYKLATHNHVFSLTGDIIKNREIGLFLVSRMKAFSKAFSYTKRNVNAYRYYV